MSPQDLDSPDTDPYLWLEDVQGPAALDWVRRLNHQSRSLLEQQPHFHADRERFKAILDSRERIPAVTRRGEHLYNLWRDEAHPRGLWRRTTLQSFCQPEPDWDTLLDLDALALAEGENWVWSRARLLGGDSPRALISLSRGGADATVLREFDLATRQFVPEGFSLPEAKTDIHWLDADHCLVGSDFGPGTLTDSGYARQIRLWQRGQPISQATLIFEARQTDVSAFASVDRTPGCERVLLGRSPDFYTHELSQWDRASGRLQPIPKPLDADLSFWRDQVLVRLRRDWTVAGRTWPGGSLLIGPVDAFLAGPPQLHALFTPSATCSLDSFDLSASQVLVTEMDQVVHRLVAWRRDADGRWQRRVLPTPSPGTLQVQALHDPLLPQDADPLAEQFLLAYVDFLTPDSLYLGQTAPSGQADPPLQRLKSRPAFFDATGMQVEQRLARSADGTAVPYFLVWPAGAQPAPASPGDHPTLLYGYGGFEVSLAPWYSPGWGQAWLARGGVLAVANIRGGGEFGPAWHQAALKARKQRSYDDFIAVAEHLIDTGVTRPARLGIQGGSNGGLLVGAVLMQRPELFNAMVCQVPLLDMRRYHRLLAGASWMAEYGNPDDPADWAVIRRYSPYQNLRAERHYPRVFFVTSTRDDRVHPGHARKMAARMIEQGHAVLYHENIEGGHGGAADNAQLADRQALEIAYLWLQLGDPT